jgi:HEPN domain-containing protein
MDTKEKIEYWIKSADHDLLSAESLFDSDRFDWCLFIGNLVIEKALKAHFVKNNNNEYPPKTHDLLFIIRKLNINFTIEQLNLIEIINNFNIEARYPDEKFSFYKQCTREFTFEYFTKIKELYIWLKSQLN